MLQYNIGNYRYFKCAHIDDVVDHYASEMIPYVDAELYVQDNKNNQTGFNELLLIDNAGNTLSSLTYSESPIISFTQDKDKDDYIYIEWLKTPEEYRRNGYSSLLIDFLSKKYNDKSILARPNSNSENILKSHNVMLI